MKRVIAFFLVLCCLFCFFTACGSDRADSGDAADTADTPNTPDPVPDPSETAIAPLPVTLDLSHLDDCTVAVSLNKGDAYVDDTGVMQMKLTIYTYDLYDMVDIAGLEVGDSILIRQEAVVITELVRDDNGAVRINGGLDNGGYELRTDEDGVFYEIGYSDLKSYFAIGEATIPVSADFTYTDSSNPDQEPAVYPPGDFLTDGTAIDYHFVPDNTTVVIEGGKIIAMTRIYTP